MEHNRLAEEGYYLAIPSGRTKNFILSEKARERERESRPLLLLRFLSFAGSRSFSFSYRFFFPASTGTPLDSFRGNAAGRFSLVGPRHPPSWAFFRSSLRERELRGAAAPASLVCPGSTI